MWQVGFDNGNLDLSHLDHQLDGPVISTDSKSLNARTKSVKFNRYYRSGTLNSNTVNSKFHLIRSFFEILARILSFHV